jgi:ribosomal protein S18 acetylase RimI-like enzyme
MIIGSEADYLDASQYPAATDVLCAAFQDYPLMRHCVPDDGRRVRAVRSLYASVLRYTLRYGDTYATPGLEGVSCWLRPDDPFPTFWRMVRIGMLSVPWNFGVGGFRRLEAVDKIAEARHREHAPGKHWYLWVIGVAPAHQGQGVAGRLMRPVFDKADRDEMRCYLETHKEANVAIYQRYGFRVASQTPVPGSPLTLYAMLRSPHAGPLERA